MNDEIKVHSYWKTLAPLARQATQILEGWRKYSRQVDRLNELQQMARAACARGAYAQEDDEPHWAIVRRINGLRSEQAAIYHRAATVLLDLEDVLPLEKIEALEREISPASVRRTCQGIVTAAKYLNEHCGPAPAGWPGSSDGDANVLLDEWVINALAMQVKEMEMETSSAELSIEALFNRILKKRNIGLETWLREHDIKRSTFMDWKAASGKPVRGKVSAAKAREFEQAIRREAIELGLISTVHLATEI